MSNSEELRETIVSMQLEIEVLRREKEQASTLLNALDALLVVSDESDPFASVFDALLPMFSAELALVLEPVPETDDIFECVASNHGEWMGSRWKPDNRLIKVLGGRILTTISNHYLSDCRLSGSGVLHDQQPALYLPMGRKDRRGLLILIRREGEMGFDRNDVALAKKFSLLASHALAARNAHRHEVESQRLKQLARQLTESQETLAYRANHDQLTGLPNRTYIQELVDSRLANKTPGQKLALAFIDLDDFKRVNDLYGHAAGDALLSGVAKRIRSQIRENDILGRISGDEFVVVLDPFSERREISALVGRIQKLLVQPFDIEGVQIKTSGSIGIAFYPTHGQSYESLRRNADAAMYQAKSASKGSTEYFSRSLGRAMTERMRLEQKLRDAFDKQQFKCALQAKFDIRTRRVVGFEVLVRWVDDRGQIHAPGTFLQPASELGLLDGIADMQIDELLSRMPELNARYGSHVRFSFNVSADQASRPTFMKSIIRHLTSSGAAERFVFELTEESFLKAEAFQTQILPLLRTAGIGISIDDFGTGYSSLSLLADITADEIKIDRSFIKSIETRSDHQSILRAIESLATALRIRLVAEGIENQRELHYLQDRTSIRYGQGFLFHRPAFIDDLLSHQPVITNDGAVRAL